MKDNNIVNFLKNISDDELDMLLNVQKEIDKEGTTVENIVAITKNLTDSQKENLKKLYKIQIEKYKNDTDKLKNDIIEIRKKLKENA